MHNIKFEIKNVIDENKGYDNIYIRNIIKEFLHIYVLDYIYSSSKYGKLVFCGGSALAHCYGLPRLSEDLDFVDVNKKIDINELAESLKDFFYKETDLRPKIKVQKFRIYLKFPILKEFNLSQASDTDLLYVKIEVFKEFDFCNKYKVEVMPIFKFNKSLFVKTFDLQTMMATKIRAVLYRQWEKIDKKGNTLLNVKGRDYFDLMWYIDKGIKPNFNCIEISKKDELIKKLKTIIKKVDERSILLDLKSLVSDEKYVKNIGSNVKKILLSKIDKMFD